MTDLLALAARCEAATAASRELDGEIFRALSKDKPYRGMFSAKNMPVTHVVSDGMTMAQAIEAGCPKWRAASLYGAPCYTASLDAAMTLVPDGARFIIDSDGCHCRITEPDDETWPWNGFAGLASTMALALCAAALRAQPSPES